MKNNNRQAFIRRWQETTDIPPQTIGPFTPYYKELTKRLKVMPLPILIAISLILVGGMLYLIGPAITSYASLLQRGF